LTKPDQKSNKKNQKKFQNPKFLIPACVASHSSVDANSESVLQYRQFCLIPCVISDCFPAFYFVKICLLKSKKCPNSNIKVLVVLSSQKRACIVLIGGGKVKI
jgi:hypothetical protein